MKKFGRLLGVLLGMAILSLVVTLVPHKDANAQSPAQVQVVNTPLPVSVASRVAVSVLQNPLPVTVRGIAVSAPLPVSVGSLPPVTLNGTSAVSLSNNEFSPVIVEPYAAAAINNYGGFQYLAGPLSPNSDGQNNCTSFPGILSGTRLVMESVTLFAQVPSGTIVENAYFGSTPPDGIVVPYGFLVPTKVSSNASSDYYVASASIRAYSTSGTQLGVGITTSPNPANGVRTPFSLQCTVLGHTVPGP
jgi:hypothetical protein